MDQHIPTVSRADVERIAVRDFPEHQVSKVLQTLSAFGLEVHHREIERVHLDILKLANGNFDRLVLETENACGDYRDTMLAAEYPNYAKKMFRVDTLSADQRRGIVNADRHQYNAWFDRKTTSGQQSI
ncbi:MAG: hypothetical protein AAGD22_11185 [Verrucomicrobiota bacterium]